MSKHEWAQHSLVFLAQEGTTEFAGMIDAARLAIMLGDDGGDAVARVRMPDGRAAWCAQYSAGWHCVAITPWASRWDRDTVPRAEFFAKKWPDTWATPREAKRASRAAEGVAKYGPPVAGGMAWASDPTGRVRCAYVESVDPLKVVLRPGEPAEHEDTTGMKWRCFAKNVDGLKAEWDAGTLLFHNFRFMCMKAGLRQKYLEKRQAKQIAQNVQKEG
jgi:hypothetical protein